MNKIIVKDFSLKHTLESGQVFRVEFYDGHYYFIVGDKVLKLRQDNNTLYWGCNKKISSSFIRQLFRLNAPYIEIINSISKDSFIRSAIKKSFGIRMIMQDPWECMISYICSSNSSVRGVKRQVDNLSRKFGRKIVFNGKVFYSFPKKLGSIDELKACGLGFRARHLFEAVSEIDRKGLVELKKKRYSEARTQLIKLKGVGPKVADCILLYSLDFTNAFPIDRWIRRVMEEKYFAGKKAGDLKIEEFAHYYFEKNAGYAQLFIYYYGRVLKN